LYGEEREILFGREATMGGGGAADDYGDGGGADLRAVVRGEQL
jgi:hypothetical protein